MKHTEVEFKYEAKIGLEEFEAFCSATRSPGKKVTSSGHDHFFYNYKNDGCFYRLRQGNNYNELTFKRKSNLTDNFIRTEHNITLGADVTKEQVTDYLNEHQYHYTTSIYKNSFVYIYDYYLLAYYICYDSQMEELGRFIEIEIKEDYNWRNEKEAWDELVALERLCKLLGAKPEARIKSSLFEMYKDR